MNKILIIKLSALGDVFMALPHMDVILSHHQEDRVWLMTSQSFVPIFAHHPRLHLVSLNRGHRLGGESRLARILWTREQRFDVIYDLQSNRTSRLLVRFSKAPRRVGIKPYGVYTHCPERPIEDNPDQSVFERLNEALGIAGLNAAEPRSRLYVDARDREMVSDWKKMHGLDKRPYVLLHAGSSPEWLSKRWPEDYFATLARFFTAKGIQCVWIGTREEGPINKRLAARIGIDATGEDTPLQLYLWGQGALCAIVNDSGPMHILASAGIPVYAFFGPTNWIRSHAVGQKQRVLRTPVPCSPCFKKVCPPDKQHACMTGIDPDTVIARISSDLNLGT